MQLLLLTTNLNIFFRSTKATVCMAGQGASQLLYAIAFRSHRIAESALKHAKHVCIPVYGSCLAWYRIVWGPNYKTLLELLHAKCQGRQADAMKQAGMGQDGSRRKNVSSESVDLWISELFPELLYIRSTSESAAAAAVVAFCFWFTASIAASIRPFQLCVYIVASPTQGVAINCQQTWLNDWLTDWLCGIIRVGIGIGMHQARNMFPCFHVSICHVKCQRIV